MDTKAYKPATMIVFALLQACTLETASDADPSAELDPEDVGSIEEPLPVSGSEYRWDQGNPPTPMGSSSDRFCFLTLVRGHFEGSGEAVRAYVSGGSWYLGGESQQNSVTAKARCVALSWNGRSYGYSGQYSWRQNDNPTFLGSASNRTCLLTGVSGKFEGSGERVEVYRSGGNWYLGGTSQQRSVAATARCLTGSIPSGPYHWDQGQDEAVIMRATSTYACGLTRMRGKFEGSGELVRVTSSSGSWYLGGESQQRSVAASAYCMY